MPPFDGDDPMRPRAEVVARVSQSKGLRTLRALPAIQLTGSRTLLEEEEEAKESVALEGLGDGSALYK